MTIIDYADKELTTSYFWQCFIK